MTPRELSDWARQLARQYDFAKLAGEAAEALATAETQAARCRAEADRLHQVIREAKAEYATLEAEQEAQAAAWSQQAQATEERHVRAFEAALAQRTREIAEAKLEAERWKLQAQVERDAHNALMAGWAREEGGLRRTLDELHVKLRAIREALPA